MDTTSSVTRVPAHTNPEINQWLNEETRHRIEGFYKATPEEIDRRLLELENEWDIERTLEANAALISLIGVTLAVSVDKRWLALPAAVGGFLLQHAIQGWCPPLPVLRRLGFRTPNEIDEERFELRRIQEQMIR
jgi:hypothetical protein